MSTFFKVIPFYALLVLACMNFLGRGPIVFFISMIIGICFMTRNSYEKQSLTLTNFLPFLLLTIITCITSFYNFEIKDTIKTFNFLLAYYLGVSIYNKSEDNEGIIRNVITYSVIGFLINLILIYYINLIVLHHDIGVRNLFDYWTGEYTPGTLVGLLSAMPIAISYYLIAVSELKIYKLLGFVIVVFVCIINNATATRTPFVLLILVFFIMTLCIMKENRGKVIIASCIAIAVALSMYEFNAFNLYDIINNSAIVARFNEESTSTSRVDVTLYYFGILFDYPFGGKHGAEVIGFEPHNFIQEMQFLYGIFPFLICLFISIKIVILLIRFYRASNKKNIDVLLMASLLSVFVQCLLEPVYAGYPQLLWLLFLLTGMGEMRLRDITYLNNLEHETLTY